METVVVPNCLSVDCISFQDDYEILHAWLKSNLAGSYIEITTPINKYLRISISFVDIESKAYFLLRFPDWNIYKGDLNLGHCTGLTALPEGLSVSGVLNLWRCTSLTALPEGLSVGGNLNLWGCTGLTALPEGLNVSGNLYLGDCTGLTALPEGLSVSGYLSLVGCTGLAQITNHPGILGCIFH